MFELDVGYKQTLLQALGILYLIAVHFALGYLIVERFRTPAMATPTETQGPSASPSSSPTPSASPTIAEVIPAPIEVPTPVTPEAPGRLGSLLVPVAGIRPEQLADSYTDARSNGRVHDAIDIMAPGGTPVLATTDGEIIKFFDSKAGGITIYQSSVDKKYIYYYAHLQQRANDIKEGDLVKKGRTIGYVGDTGNAGTGNYHLHFSIALAKDPKRFWDGEYINPYPLLRP